MEFFDIETGELDLNVVRTVVFSVSILLARIGIHITVDENSDAFSLDEFCRVSRQLLVYRRSALYKLMVRKGVPAAERLSTAEDGSLRVGDDRDGFGDFGEAHNDGCCEGWCSRGLASPPSAY